jgi:hypothetical protein
LAITFDCLLRVDNQVEKHLTELIRARPDERQRLVKCARDANAESPSTREFLRATG